MADQELKDIFDDGERSPDGTELVYGAKQDGTADYAMILSKAVAYLFTTAGDILIATGAKAGARLGIGTSGQVLRTNAGATAPEWKTDPGTFRVKGTVSDPNGYYDQRPLIPLFRADAAITITRIHIHGPDSTPTTELDIDLKFADDIFDGSLANATVIDVCDTTSGQVTITSGMDDPTVPSGKYIYWSFGAQPHADWLDFWFEIYYTYD